MKINISKFEFQQKYTSHIKTNAMNFDAVFINKHTNKMIIIEYLKRSKEQADYITPLTSHPNKYFRQNKKKFLGYKHVKEHFNAEVFFINYAEENSVSEDGRINFGEMIKVMKLEDVDPADNKTPVKMENEWRFNSFNNFDNWFSEFIENNCWSIQSNYEDITGLSIEEAKKYLSKLEPEYRAQQEKIKNNSLNGVKKLIMPDISGDLFEARFKSFKRPLSMYKLLAEKQYLLNIKGKEIYCVENILEVIGDPFEYSNEDISNLLNKQRNALNFAFNNSIIITTVISIENNFSDNILFLKDFGEKTSIENLSLNEYKEKIVNISKISI